MEVDMKSAFLSGDLKEEYMYRLYSFQVPRKENLVCKMKKDPYGLKYANIAWYIKIGKY
jgi:hypothetical protein